MHQRFFQASPRHTSFCVLEFLIHHAHHLKINEHISYSLPLRLILQSMSFLFLEVLPSKGSLHLSCRSLHVLPDIQALSLLPSPCHNGLRLRFPALYLDLYCPHSFLPMVQKALFRYMFLTQNFLVSDFPLSEILKSLF